MHTELRFKHLKGRKGPLVVPVETEKDNIKVGEEK
jgi:hypothetical protein